MRTGGSLQDGWSYLMPSGYHELDVSTGQLDGFPLHVHEQRDALQALYLKTEASNTQVGANSNDEDDGVVTLEDQHHFVVREGHQVVGVATYNAQSNIVSDLAIRPSAGSQAIEKLFLAIRQHAEGEKLRVRPNGQESRELLASVGFVPVADDKDSMVFAD